MKKSIKSTLKEFWKLHGLKIIGGIVTLGAGVLVYQFTHKRDRQLDRIERNLPAKTEIRASYIKWTDKFREHSSQILEDWQGDLSDLDMMAHLASNICNISEVTDIGYASLAEDAFAETMAKNDKSQVSIPLQMEQTADERLKRRERFEEFRLWMPEAVDLESKIMATFRSFGEASEEKRRLLAFSEDTVNCGQKMLDVVGVIEKLEGELYKDGNALTTYIFSTNDHSVCHSYVEAHQELISYKYYHRIPEIFDKLRRSYEPAIELMDQEILQDKSKLDR